MPRQPTSQRETDACKALKCRAAIRWVRTTGGASIPVDFDLPRGGPLIPVIHNGQKRVRDRTPGDDPARPGFVPHWQTCVDAAAWRSERQQANRGGNPAPVNQGPGILDLGPCAGCYWPRHTAYGPDSGGTLCAHCREVLDAWRTLPSPQRGSIPYPKWNPATGRREPRPPRVVRDQGGLA